MQKEKENSEDQDNQSLAPLQPQEESTNQQIARQVNRLYLFIERRDMIQQQRNSEHQSQQLLFLFLMTLVLMAYFWREYMHPYLVAPINNILETTNSILDALQVANQKLEVLKTNSFYK